MYRPAKLPRSVRKVLRSVPILQEVEKKRRVPTFFSPDLGFVPLQGLETASRLFAGFWQSYRYCLNAYGVPYVQGEQLFTAPTDWFWTKQAEAREARPIVVSVRRGDYTGTNFGVLSPDYYLQALQRLSHLTAHRPIWVFSEQEASARQLAEVGARDGYDAQTVIAPKGVSGGEEILLKAEASAHVIANSTFAWWSAFLGSHQHGGGAEVIAPSPWFQRGKTPQSLLPEDWQTHPAHFLE